MRVHESGQTVVVGDLGVAQRELVAEIERPDVILDIRYHMLPVMRHLYRRPPVFARVVFQDVPDQPRLVHQLLRNTAHVHAGSAQPPLRSLRRRLHIVHYRNPLPEARRLFGTRQAPASAANNYQVIVVHIYSHMIFFICISLL